MSIQLAMEQIQEYKWHGQRPVAAAQVLALLEEAVWAPNHHLREPWRFIWIDAASRSSLEVTLDPSTQKNLRELIRTAPACLIVAASVPLTPREAKDDFAAACCLIQNLQILAAANGLGMSWDLPSHTGYEALSFAVKLGANERIAGVLGLGHIEDGIALASGKRPGRIEVL
ncbi:nitroreductase family protein [Paenibacillus brevis]|uniref:Nitroreductase family protein n=1 Tax=Paenibacillus brevis TaxID=2841508 RepID=A0ABS6FN31_9BACL|nr:nitroreductase family protein [Paenibacillus brevis]MBU5671389.1 nitroreductase family protein [Paenibacillus brevis]